MQLHVIHDAAGLTALQREWEELSRDTPTPVLSLSYRWIDAWWRSFGKGGPQVHVLTARDEDGRLLAIMPAMKMRSRFRRVPITKLALMVNGYTPCSGIVMRRGAEASKIVTAFLEELMADPEVDLVELSRIAASSDLHRIVHEYLRASGYRFGETPDLNTPFICIDSDWPTFLSGLSPGFRKQVRRRLRSLSCGDGLEMRRIAVTDRTNQEIEDMVEISSLSWKHKRGTDIAAVPAGREFLYTLCDTFGPMEDAVVWHLLKDGKPIAFEFHVNYAGVTYPLRADHRTDFAHLSPGALLETGILKSLFDEPRSTFEYNTCGNAYDYLLRWTSTTRQYTTVQVFPRGFIPAALHAFEYKLAPALRPVLARMRAAASSHGQSGEDENKGIRSVKNWPGGARRGA